MGVFICDGVSVDFDDATLMHLMLVASTKLRRNEPFLLSWHDRDDGPASRCAVWIAPSTALRWRLAGPDPDIDRERIEFMLLASASGFGLHVEREPARVSTARTW